MSIIQVPMSDTQSLANSSSSCSSSLSSSLTSALSSSLSQFSSYSLFLPLHSHRYECSLPLIFSFLNVIDFHNLLMVTKHPTWTSALINPLSHESIECFPSFPPSPMIYSSLFYTFSKRMTLSTPCVSDVEINDNEKKSSKIDFHWILKENIRTLCSLESELQKLSRKRKEESEAKALPSSLSLPSDSLLSPSSSAISDFNQPDHSSSSHSHLLSLYPPHLHLCTLTIMFPLIKNESNFVFFEEMIDEIIMFQQLRGNPNHAETHEKTHVALTPSGHSNHESHDDHKSNGESHQTPNHHVIANSKLSDSDDALNHHVFQYDSDDDKDDDSDHRSNSALSLTLSSPRDLPLQFYPLEIILKCPEFQREIKNQEGKEKKSYVYLYPMYFFLCNEEEKLRAKCSRYGIKLTLHCSIVNGEWNTLSSASSYSSSSSSHSLLGLSSSSPLILPHLQSLIVHRIRHVRLPFHVIFTNLQILSLCQWDHYPLSGVLPTSCSSLTQLTLTVAQHAHDYKMAMIDAGKTIHMMRNSLRKVLFRECLKDHLMHLSLFTSELPHDRYDNITQMDFHFLMTKDFESYRPVDEDDLGYPKKAQRVDKLMDKFPNQNTFHQPYESIFSLFYLSSHDYRWSHMKIVSLYWRLIPLVPNLLAGTVFFFPMRTAEMTHLESFTIREMDSDMDGDLHSFLFPPRRALAWHKRVVKWLTTRLCQCSEMRKLIFQIESKMLETIMTAIAPTIGKMKLLSTVEMKSHQIQWSARDMRQLSMALNNVTHPHFTSLTLSKASGKNVLHHLKTLLDGLPLLRVLEIEIDVSEKKPKRKVKEGKDSKENEVIIPNSVAQYSLISSVVKMTNLTSLSIKCQTEYLMHRNARSNSPSPSSLLISSLCKHNVNLKSLTLHLTGVFPTYSQLITPMLILIDTRYEKIFLPRLSSFEVVFDDDRKTTDDDEKESKHDEDHPVFYGAEECKKELKKKSEVSGLCSEENMISHYEEMITKRYRGRCLKKLIKHFREHREMHTRIANN